MSEEPAKFIPSTGVTLPLISYGGSSIITTIVIFSIIQGMYVLKSKERQVIMVERRERELIETPEKGSKPEPGNGGGNLSFHGNLIFDSWQVISFILWYMIRIKVLNNPAE